MRNCDQDKDSLSLENTVNFIEETIDKFNNFQETIVNFQWFLRRPSPLDFFGGLTIAINSF